MIEKVLQEKNGKTEKYNPNLPPRKRFKGEIIGELASIISVVALLPLAWEVTSTGNVSNIQISWMFVKLVAIGMWFYFAWVNMIIPNIICSVGIGAIIIYLIGCKLLIRS